MTKACPCRFKNQELNSSAYAMRLRLSVDPVLLCAASFADSTARYSHAHGWSVVCICLGATADSERNERSLYKYTALQVLRQSVMMGSPSKAHWCPSAASSPIFLRYNCNDSTVKALTQSQVELHKLRTAHLRLSDQSKHNAAEWERLKSQMVIHCNVTCALGA